MPTSESVPVTTTLQKEKINPAMRTAAEIRKDFPILARQVHGKPLVYLDSTSSSQKPYAVIEAMNTYYEMDHHSNLVPWQLLAQRTGARLEFVPVTDEGLLKQEVYEQLLQQQPKLVAFTHMSNVLGTINPARKMITQAHAVGAIVLLDAAQSVPHLHVDVQDLDIDFLCFSSHKMLGPTGIGVLYGKRDLLEAMPPFMGGGDMIRKVGLRASTWNDLPWKFEAGTPAIAEAVGLGVAVDYLNTLGMEHVFKHEQEITAYALEQLQTIPGLIIYAPDVTKRGGVISFTLADIHPHDLASILDQEMGVAIRAGHHCAQPLMERFGLAATARASFYVYSLREDIDALVQGLRKALQIFNL